MLDEGSTLPGLAVPQLKKKVTWLWSSIVSLYIRRRSSIMFRKVIVVSALTSHIIPLIEQFGGVSDIPGNGLTVTVLESAVVHGLCCKFLSNS